MHLIGITGGIATGKSAVTSRLSQMKYPVIDGDEVSRFVVRPDRPAFRKIREAFGDEVITPTGELNRVVLGNIVFNSEEKRKQLNAIVHPEIHKEIVRRSFWYLLQRKPIVFLDIPLLYESGRVVRYLSKVIVVSCRPEQQLQRLMSRNDLSEAEAAARVNCQMDLEEKCRRADFVIDNSGDLEDTLRQVHQIEEVLRKRYNSYISRYLLLDTLFALIGALVGWLLFTIYFS